MTKVTLKIINSKTKQFKLIDASEYTMEDLQKTFQVYEACDRFQVKIIRN